MSSNLIDLRAEVAKRVEDLRIATKHREEAGGRMMAAAEKLAYRRAVEWEDLCRTREQRARGILIRATQAEVV